MSSDDCKRQAQQIVAEMLEEAKKAPSKTPFIWTNDVVEVVDELVKKNWDWSSIHDFFKSRGLGFSQGNMYATYRKWKKKQELEEKPSEI